MAQSMRKSIFGRQFGLDDNGYMVGESRVSQLLFSVAAGSSNVANVTIQAANYEGNSIAGVRNILIWLSDSTSGIGVTSTTASGTVTATTGTDLVDLTAKKAKIIQTDATGKIVLAITDTAKTAFKVCYELTNNSGAIVGATLATASYG